MKGFAPRGGTCFLLEFIPTEKGGKNKMVELLSLKVYPFTLKKSRNKNLLSPGTNNRC